MSDGWNGHGGWGPPSTGGGPGTPGGQPDWAAMADTHERDARRKRMLRVGAGVVGGLVVVAGVAVGMVLESGGSGMATAGATTSATSKASSPAASASAAPSPSAPSYAAATTGLVLGASAHVNMEPGHAGPSLVLTGHSDSFAEATKATLDTTHSFTVSAVVRNDAAAHPKAVVSQGNGVFFSYYLGRDDSAPNAHDRWVFKVQTAAALGKSVMALSRSQAVTGVWTTLTGVYNAKAHTIALYVDGVQVATEHVPGMLPTHTPVEIGRARYKSHWADAWQGAIADVRIWQRPFTSAQVAAQAQADAAGTPAPVPATAGWLTAA